jgi:DNA polymerase-3 subunit gamma/tau
MLTREAFNALLKTLEEPPEHVVFILATTESHKVPDTIISRTQRFTFRPIKQEDTVNHLASIAKKEKLKISDEALTLLATHGKGSFRDSISMLDQLAGIASDEIGVEEVTLLLGLPDTEIIESILQNVVNSDIPAIFADVQRLREKGIDSGKAANALSASLRQLLLEQSSFMSQTTILALLQELLKLSLTTNDYIGLELALLKPVTHDVVQTPMPTSQTPTTKVAEKTEEKLVEKKEQQTPTKAPKPDPVVEVTPEPSKQEERPPEVVSSETAEPSAESKDAWQEMLSDIKKKHNTLYGILRMAKFTDSKEPYEIIFSFGFHKKQLDNPKNTAILAEYFRTYFNNKTFTTITDTKAKRPPEPKLEPTKVNSDEILSNVSNIFGGAELLES